MAKNKKPRKQRKERAVHLPMMAGTRDRLALSLHLAVEVLINRPTVDSYNSLSTKFCTLSNAGIDNDALRSGSLALVAICDRYERVGKVGVTGDEAAALRDSVGLLDAALASIPANKLAAAEAITATHCEAMGI